MTGICLLSGPWSTPSLGTEEANGCREKDNSPAGVPLPNPIETLTGERRG